MPCYHPLTAYYNGLEVVFGLKKARYNPSGYEQIQLPCGRCIGCRLERSRQWAFRCVAEASQHSENCFITLTYAPEHLPKSGTLVKRDLTLFFKRLRKLLGSKPIRYFACGEYGDLGQRPHYHAIIFGHDFADKEWQVVQSEKGFSRVGISPSLNALWPFGFTTVGKCTFESCAYVARYCLKKLLGATPEQLKEHYGERIPEYVVMSRRPGIGAEWIKRYLTDVYPSDKVIVRGHECKPPRFFDRYFEKFFAEDEKKCLQLGLDFGILKAERKTKAIALDLTPERLEELETLANLRQSRLRR